MAVGAAMFTAFAVRGAGIGAALLGAAVTGAAWWGAVRIRPEADPDRWLRGAQGERATAEVLARLPRRFVVGHDLVIPASRSNIDHLVIGPTGVFVIDSKAYRGRVRVRGRSVWAGEWQVDAGPVAWQANRVAEVADVPVRAVIAIHGSGLRNRGVDDGGVWIVPAGRVAAVMRRGRRAWWHRRDPRVTPLSGSQISAIAQATAPVFGP
jgi:hypothetical protein